MDEGVSCDQGGTKLWFKAHVIWIAQSHGTSSSEDCVWLLFQVQGSVKSWFRRNRTSFYLNRFLVISGSGGQPMWNSLASAWHKHWVIVVHTVCWLGHNVFQHIVLWISSFGLKEASCSVTLSVAPPCGLWITGGSSLHWGHLWKWKKIVTSTVPEDKRQYGWVALFKEWCHPTEAGWHLFLCQHVHLFVLPSGRNIKKGFWLKCRWFKQSRLCTIKEK